MNQVNDRQRIESKIAFLNQQFDSLDYFLPETYRYLLEEMDYQQVLLKRLDVQESFASIDSCDSFDDPSDS